MSLSRRTFMKTAGIGGVGFLSAPLIAARGSEAGRGLEPWPGESGSSLAVPDRNASISQACLDA